MHTTAANLQPTIKFVIHTVGPNAELFVGRQNELFGIVRDTFISCIMYANSTLKASSIAIPGISAGKLLCCSILVVCSDKLLCWNQCRLVAVHGNGTDTLLKVKVK